jgi:hypothetical protein
VYSVEEKGRTPAPPRRFLVDKLHHVREIAITENDRQMITLQVRRHLEVKQGAWK